MTKRLSFMSYNLWKIRSSKVLEILSHKQKVMDIEAIDNKIMEKLSRW